MALPPIVIDQDHEYDEMEGEIGGPMSVFWAKGHGFDEHEFIRAVVDYCLHIGIDIPRITGDDGPRELWQQNVKRADGVEYRRGADAPTSPRSPLFPVTVLDLDRPRRRAGRTCAANGCEEPRYVGSPIKVAVEPSDGDVHMSVELWLCREHHRKLPDPYYRVCLVPVGATIDLPQPASA